MGELRRDWVGEDGFLFDEDAFGASFPVAMPLEHKVLIMASAFLLHFAKFDVKN